MVAADTCEPGKGQMCTPTSPGAQTHVTINRIMFSPEQRSKGKQATPAAAQASVALMAAMPYIKFLDTALKRLPQRFWYAGIVSRGVRWVFPSPETHDPEAHFKPGASIVWYEFKVSSFAGN